MSNLVITAHDEGQRKELKEQMARQVWRDGTVECIMHVLRHAHDPTQLMSVCEVMQAFLDDDDSARKMILATDELDTRSDVAGLEMIGTLLDRLVEFQWDLDFCSLGVVTIARFAELEDEEDRSRREQGRRQIKRARGENGAEIQEPTDVLVRAGCVQVLIGELEDCADNQSAADVAKECLNALDNIAILSQDARRGMVGMGGVRAVARVIREHGLSQEGSNVDHVEVVRKGTVFFFFFFVFIFSQKLIFLI